MAFVDDHLNKRKRDIDLHLGIDSPTNTIEGDQTPTPTRFIRNCEEVGLFQDLQNVNPFDETFRKATELANSGSLHLPEVSGDDSLHTPHILPHIEEFASSDKANCDYNAVPSIHDAVLKVDDKKSKNECNIDYSTSIINLHTIKTPIVNNNEGIIKLKLKEALINRNKVEAKISTEEIITLSLSDKSNLISQTEISKRIDKHINKEKLSKLTPLERKRETNRAAQIRNRQRKKHQFGQLLNELVMLRTGVKQLSEENKKLKDEVLSLKSVLVSHKDCPIFKYPTVVQRVDLLEKSSNVEKEQIPKTSRVEKKLLPIHPISSAFINLAQVPLKFHVPTQPGSILASLTPFLPKQQFETSSSATSKVTSLGLNSISKSVVLENRKVNRNTDKTKAVKKK